MEYSQDYYYTDSSLQLELNLRSAERWLLELTEESCVFSGLQCCCESGNVGRGGVRGSTAGSSSSGDGEARNCGDAERVWEVANDQEALSGGGEAMNGDALSSGAETCDWKVESSGEEALKSDGKEAWSCRDEESDWEVGSSDQETLSDGGMANSCGEENNSDGALKSDGRTELVTSIIDPLSWSASSSSSSSQSDISAQSTSVTDPGNFSADVVDTTASFICGRSTNSSSHSKISAESTKVRGSGILSADVVDSNASICCDPSAFRSSNFISVKPAVSVSGAAIVTGTGHSGASLRQPVYHRRRSGRSRGSRVVVELFRYLEKPLNVSTCTIA